MTGIAAATPSTLMASATAGEGAGLMAFFIVAALFVVCGFLYRSMRRQLGRIDVTRGQSAPTDTDKDAGSPAP